MKILDRRPNRGSATAEVAVTIPVLMFVVLGLVDLGRGVAAKAALGSVARAATRYASVHSATSGDPATVSKIASYVRERIDDGMDPDAVTVTASWSPSNQRGSKVIINVAYDFAPIMPFIPLSSIQLTSGSQLIISN